jgi:hypothetical protein
MLLMQAAEETPSKQLEQHMSSGVEMSRTLLRCLEGGRSAGAPPGLEAGTAAAPLLVQARPVASSTTARASASATGRSLHVRSTMRARRSLAGPEELPEGVLGATCWVVAASCMGGRCGVSVSLTVRKLA